MNETLRPIELFANEAHADQRNKHSDEPYVNHLVRVKQYCNTVTSDPVVLATALLHDLFEKTPVTEQELRSFLQNNFSANDAEQVILMVKDLTVMYTSFKYPALGKTKRKEMEMNRLEQKSDLVQTIKCADILDNSTTLESLESGEAIEKLNEYQQLLKLLTKADKDLHKRATDAVEHALLTVSSR
ncbi:MAG: HD domain-containing protein [Agriterribacter sp.]